ncbi:MAG: YidC/Oxa1 family membrane protein insertase [Candidatus Sacchiramonaceae bacterium]|nr:YidC/Oxa1 family membrane protein insertase [Candidatus Saccharimonadaceae bacterium]
MNLFDTAITQPIFNLLLTIYNFVGDFGVTIIIFTVIVKLILWPITKSQLHQTKVMRKMQPELKKIKRNAKGNKQLESIQMMELYKKHNVKPFRSLLVLIIQLPILLTLNNVINITVNKSNEISNFTYSSVSNLSRVSDIIRSPADFTPHLFGVVDLTTSAVPVEGVSSVILLLIAIVSAVLMWYTTKQQQPKQEKSRRLRDIMQEASSGKEPDQAEISQIVSRQMSFLLPIMIFTTMINIYGAINVYFFINNLLQVAQQKFILDKDQKELVEIANEPAKRSKNAKEAKIIKKPAVSKGKSGTKITRITAKDNKRKGKK